MFFEVLENFNSIYLQDFVNLFENQNDEFKELDKGLKLVEFLEEYRRITNSNSHIIEDYIKLIENFISIIEYNIKLSRRESLLEELELSKVKQKSGDIAAKTDLINKLKESINSNKSQLKYFEEDYLNLKNQINQINQIKERYNKQIQELNAQKKEYFSEINKITREMSAGIQKGKKDDLSLDFESKEVSQAEKIQNFQKKAQESQYEINQINSKLNEIALKFNEVNPRYKKLDSDHQNLKKVINRDEIRLEKLQHELKYILEKNQDLSIERINFSTLTTIRDTQEIEDEVSTLKNEIEAYENSINFVNSSNPADLSILIQKFHEFNTNLTNKEKDYIISMRNDEIFQCIYNFRKLEALKKKIETFINKFLLDINLKCNFFLTIDETYKSFTLNLQFIRSNKEEVDFDSLTTPEKIFFIITFYLSFKVLLKSPDIIFSNLLLPGEYNKRGSVFRTISKAINIFENEEDLKEFNLIFIISNLDMKKPIDNIIIENIGEIKD